MAVVPLYVTVPVTGDWLLVTWKLDVLIVDASITSRNVAVIDVLIETFDALLIGFVEITIGDVLSGHSSPITEPHLTIPLEELKISIPQIGCTEAHVLPIAYTKAVPLCVIEIPVTSVKSLPPASIAVPISGFPSSTRIALLQMNLLPRIFGIEEEY